MSTEGDRLIERAKVQLLLNFPFFGKVACHVNWVSTDTIPTACTDGETIWWNPKFMETLSPDEINFVAAHEIHHIVKKHMFRRKDRDSVGWNVATDFQINDELIQCGLKMPKDCLYDKKYSGWLEEAIYNDLPKELVDKMKSAMYPCGIGEVIDSPHRPDSVEGEQAQAKIDRIIEEAAQYAKNQGKLPGCLADYCEDNRRHQVDWKAQLRRFVAPVIARDVSWESPNRRMLAHSVYLPGPRKDGTGKIAVGIDTSGSISSAEISQFVAEMRCIFGEVEPEEIHLIWFNSHVWHYDMFTSGADMMLPSKIQSGGTAFEPVFDLIKDRGISPKCLIMLTDMYANFPPRPNYPVIWCATTDIKGPYGSTVGVKIEH